MLSRYVVSQVKHNSYFLVGLALGLWLALAAVPLDEEATACDAAATVPAPDDYEPHREERLMGPAGQPGRSVQRPRYYSTELGMRGGLLAGVLSSEEVLETRAAALNRTAARLQPALRFFITASALQAAPGRANVVGFTDTREMLKPFHALKYLADNYLEEYDFFFLVSDTSFVNAHRLTELVSKLSVSQDIYMGVAADDDTHYCTLENGILLSNSVLRAIHGELDWCVRNSYSPHHHENLGRCVLHAAHLSCISSAQGENYTSMQIESGAEEAGVSAALVEALADAVVAFPATDAQHFYQLHAFVSRVYLERAQAEISRNEMLATVSARHHPRGYRNVSWPPALRDDAGLSPPLPPTRFDHLRWTRFNASHAFMLDDHRMLAELPAAYKEAVALIVEEARAWTAQRWSDAEEEVNAAEVSLEEGAWCWEPPRALRYRLLLRLPVRQKEGAGHRRGKLVQVEVARPLGAARLAPARYVTESARVSVLLPVPAEHAATAAHFLQRYDSVCLQKDANTALVMVLISREKLSSFENTTVNSLREAAQSLAGKRKNTQIEVVEVSSELSYRGVRSEAEVQREAARTALAEALHKFSSDSLILLSLPHMEFTEDFLNRVRMNTISGEQWFSPLPFTRHAQYAHPRFVDADGNKPQQNTGGFAPRAFPLVASFYKRDYVAALERWRESGGGDADAAEVLAAAPLRAVRAPEPSLLLPPRAEPCRAAPGDSTAHWSCLRRERERGFSQLQLGARHALAKLLLETQADIA